MAHSGETPLPGLRRFIPASFGYRFARRIAICLLALLDVTLSPGRQPAAGPASPGADLRPNLVLIVADDLGYRDLSCYGNKEFKTPHLDRMAAEGVRLKQFYVASPSCSPSRAALLTAQYPMRAGVHLVLNPRSTTGLPAASVTLPELLRDSGYRTAMVGKWHLGHRPEFLPTKHGFKSYYGIPYSNDMKPAPIFVDEKLAEAEADQTTLTRSYTNKAEQWIHQAAENRGKPFFLCLAHNFPHVPLHVSPEFKGASGSRLYGDVVQEIDWSVGRILSALTDAGVDRGLWSCS